jgi:hypothetical protein
MTTLARTVTPSWTNEELERKYKRSAMSFVSVGDLESEVQRSGLALQVTLRHANKKPKPYGPSLCLGT